jgi:hypothetical protein
VLVCGFLLEDPNLSYYCNQVHTTLYLSPATMSALKDAASDKGVSTNSLISQFIHNGLAELYLENTLHHFETLEGIIL